MRFWLACLSLMAVQLAAAAEPAIREIAYEGNRVTQELTMSREIVVAVGEPADPRRIERSRQAIQDLGLFRDVQVRQEPLGDGVRLVFTVLEKWYVLPIPRIEANSDGDTGLGGQLRWSNVWGLNHSLYLVAVRRDYQREDRDSSFNYFVDYEIPFLGSSRNALGVSLSHATQESTSPAGADYREQFDRFGLLLSRSLNRNGPPSQGWKVGAGLDVFRQGTSGEEAPRDWGVATSPIFKYAYTDVRDHIYSRTGQRLRGDIRFAWDRLASDYNYFSHSTEYRLGVHVGRRPHQTLHLTFDISGYHAGPAEREPKAYELGGSSRLRGYERERIEGDFLYYTSIEFLRPVHWDWLRLLTVLEAGSAIDDIGHPGEGGAFYASLGIGLRARFTWFVNLDVEIGIAHALVDADDPIRVFAGGR